MLPHKNAFVLLGMRKRQLLSSAVTAAGLPAAPSASCPTLHSLKAPTRKPAEGSARDPRVPAGQLHIPMAAGPAELHCPEAAPLWSARFFHTHPLCPRLSASPGATGTSEMSPRNDTLHDRLPSPHLHRALPLTRLRKRRELNPSAGQALFRDPDVAGGGEWLRGNAFRARLALRRRRSGVVGAGLASGRSRSGWREGARRRAGW